MITASGKETLMYDRLKQQMDFLLELDKLKHITRQTYLADGSRKENDSEHSWHLAVMCLVLSEYSNEPIDVLKTVSMVLIHDIIEIYAGDTYAYDAEAAKTKKERETDAADRLFGMLPGDQAEMFRSLWDEFELKETPEARFADTLDHIQPLLLNHSSEGKSWEEHGIVLSQVLNRNQGTRQGSETLWHYGLYNNIMPNVRKGVLYYDKEGFDLLRYELAFDRIIGLEDDIEDLPVIYRGFFSEMAAVFKAYYECTTWINDNNRRFLAPYSKWYKNISFDELYAQNKSVNRFRYDPDYYVDSYANPDVSVTNFGKNIGQMISYLAAKICSLGSLCFEEEYFDMTVTAELFLEIYGIIMSEDEERYEGCIKSAIYYHEHDYMEEIFTRRVRKSLDPEYLFFSDCLNNMDLNDERSLFLYGENISENELATFRHLMTLSDDDIKKTAYAYVNGYVTSFKLAGIDLSKKENVQIRYPIGFERIIRCAIDMFAENGLRPVILRSSSIGTGISPFQTGCIDTNPQFAFDHKFDKAIYYNKAINDMMLVTIDSVYGKYAKLADVYAGPAVVEHFGEESFEPVYKNSACSLDEEQQKLQVEYSIQASNIVNRYIKRDSYSFTIIAFPLPSIGPDYESIFNECIKINTLDTERHEKIQKKLIDALDGKRKVHITGMNGNETDLYISLTIPEDLSAQTIFHNCLADCNIPVGEVYTSPVLNGTTGLLNVNKVYINGLEYKDLKIQFKDGMTGEYSCSNFDDEAMSHKFIKDNLMKQHESLPMGEFAIGTNTVAYKMAREYNIADKLPILIAEKTGPHIAIGDTCFSMSEDIPVYNPDGKEMIARDNEVSLLRSEDMNKAYFGCHTDITIPYDDLGCLSAIDDDGNETVIIKNGRFVLPGTEELNDMR